MLIHAPPVGFGPLKKERAWKPEGWTLEDAVVVALFGWLTLVDSMNVE